MVNECGETISTYFNTVSQAISRLEGICFKKPTNPKGQQHWKRDAVESILTCFLSVSSHAYTNHIMLEMLRCATQNIFRLNMPNIMRPGTILETVILLPVYCE